MTIKFLFKSIVVTAVLTGCATEQPRPVTEDSASIHAARCAQLSQEVESLKGRPARRKAAMDRYQLECLDRR